MHRENAALWKVRPLLTRLQGDHTWAPCGIMVDPSDVDLFSDDPSIRNHDRAPQALGSHTTGTPVASGGGAAVSQYVSTDDPARDKGEGPKLIENKKSPQSGESAPEASQDNSEKPEAADGDKAADTDPGKKKTDGADEDGAEAQTNGQTSGNGGNSPKESSNGPSADGEATATGDVEMTEAPDTAESTALVVKASSKPASNHSGSRALSTSPDAAADDLFIHQLFLPPQAARPDRDQGLPEPEADDIRRLLQLYVQKQEEVCRGTERLHMGLLKADRCRKTVLKWAKAEGHCGDKRDMSDGEDWYDKEEWGLVEDLKKGQDEEEEDTAQTQKKTRNRR